MVVLLLA